MLAGVKTNLQLTNELAVLRKQYEALLLKVGQLETDLKSKPKLSDIVRAEKNLTKLINDNAADVVTLQRKLSSVILPEDPRYYLTQNEVTNFQSNLSKLLAMMTSFEALYKNLVAYSATLD